MAREGLKVGSGAAKERKDRSVHRACTEDSPPSTWSTCPVTQPCSGDNSQQMAEAMSPGSPRRPNGCIASDALRAASFPVRNWLRGVWTKPGATQWTRILIAGEMRRLEQNRTHAVHDPGQPRPLGKRGFECLRDRLRIGGVRQHGPDSLVTGAFVESGLVPRGHHDFGTRDAQAPHHFRSDAAGAPGDQIET